MENENLPKMGIIIRLELWKEAKSPAADAATPFAKGGRGDFSQTRPQLIEEPYITGRELSGTRAWVERPAGRPSKPKRAQAANVVSGVRSNEGSTAAKRREPDLGSTRALFAGA